MFGCQPSVPIPKPLALALVSYFGNSQSSHLTWVVIPHVGGQEVGLSGGQAWPRGSLALKTLIEDGVIMSRSEVSGLWLAESFGSRLWLVSWIIADFWLKAAVQYCFIMFLSPGWCLLWQTLYISLHFAGDRQCLDQVLWIVTLVRSFNINTGYHIVVIRLLLVTKFLCNGLEDVITFILNILNTVTGVMIHLWSWCGLSRYWNNNF